MTEFGPSDYCENFDRPEQPDLPYDYDKGVGPEFSFEQEDPSDNTDTELPEALRDIDTCGDNPMATEAEMPDLYESGIPDEPDSHDTIEPTTENLGPSREEGTTKPLLICAAVTATNLDSEDNCEVWLPQSNADVTPIPDECGEVGLIIGNEPRKFLGSVIKMADTFNADSTGHTAMGHDCAYFVITHLGNKVPEDTLFAHRDGSSIIVWDETTAEIVTDDTVISPGDFIVLCNDKPDGTTKEPVHFMVKANTDQGTPIYASKLGTMGPVVLSTLDEIRKFYPSNGQIRRGGELNVRAYGTSR